MRLTLTIDSADPVKIVSFWADALGYTSVGEFGVFWPLFPPDEHEPVITVQKVDQLKTGKNRVHLDVHVAELDAEIERLRHLGASPIGEIRTEHDHKWLVMADPEGNEFCVVQRPEGVDDLSRPK